MLSAMFGIVDENGNRQFREVFLVVARKNGKSLLAASIANYIFRLEGGYGTRVFCLAPKLEQADIIYNGLWAMIQLDPEWKALKAKASEKNAQRLKINDDSMLARHRQTDLMVPGTNSTVKKLAFQVKSSDGFNPSLCICDEVAAWEGEKGLKQYEVMKSGMGARPEGILLSCTTAGYVNDSIYDELVKRSTRVLLGDSKEKRLLPLIYMIDDVEKWNDINELRKSNPNMGTSVTVDYMLEEIAIAEGSLSKRTEFLTKYCNIKQNSTAAWFSHEEITNCSGEELRLEDFAESYCVGGIDLSQTTDLTSCCVVIEKNGKLFVHSHFFMPASRFAIASAEDNTPYDIYRQQGFLSLSGENYVDYHDVFEWFKTLVEQWKLYPLKIGYDRYSATYLVQEMSNYGFHMDDVYQGTNLTPVIREFEGIVKDGVISFCGNNLLMAHMLNSALKTEQEAQKVRLVKVGNRTRIDGCAALLDAMTVRMKYYGEIGVQLSNEETT
jgi:phage terminase large subunit-like protein